jgi:hypothetical protein
MKRRLTVHLSEGATASLIKAAGRPGSTKSSIVELALEQFLNGTTASAQANQSLLRRLDNMSVKMNQMARDGQISAETLALFVRYYLTITPPLPAVDQEAARALGRERFQTFVTQIGRRLASGSRLVAEVMENLPDVKPDLFSTDVTAPAQTAASALENGHGDSGPTNQSTPRGDPDTCGLSHPHGAVSLYPIEQPVASGSTEGVFSNVTVSPSVGLNGVGPNGVGPDGVGPDGVGPDGVGPDGVGPDGVGPDEISPDGVTPGSGGSNGVAPNRAGPNGAGDKGSHHADADRVGIDPQNG